MAGKALSRDYYVYVYFRPDGSPCYIGKGRGRRWEQHLDRSSNRHLARIIAKAGGDIPRVKLHVGLMHEQACTYEMALIAAIGRAPEGPLVNFTAGGEGVPGLVHSAEARSKIGAANRVRAPLSPEARARKGAKLRGIKRSAEFIAKIRAAATGKKHSEAVRAKIGAGQRGNQRCLGRVISPEHRAKTSAAMRGRKRPAEAIAKAAAANRGRKRSLVSIARIRASRVGKRHSPETIAKMSEAQKRRHSVKAVAGEASR